MTEYGLNLYWKNLLTRLFNAERRGVVFTLTEDAEDLSIRIPKRINDTEFRAGLKQDKGRLLEAVRLREGLCVTCGMDKVRHPSRKGVANNWIWETLSNIEGDCSSLLVYPMWCQSCWDSRLMWKGLTVKINASSKKARAKDSSDDPGTPVRQSRKTSPDADGDSGGGGVEVLAFTAD